MEANTSLYTIKTSNTDDGCYQYWNNENKEKGKVFDVKLGEMEKMENHDHLINIHKQAQKCLIDNNIDLANKSFLSIAAGNCWLESWLLKGINFSQFTAVDFSKHRIHKIAPSVLESYNIPLDKTRLICGDIMDCDLTPKSIDTILLSQAFHHIDEPLRLLRNCSHFLKNDGHIIIVGEHLQSTIDYAKYSIFHFGKYILNYKQYRNLNTIFPSWQDIFPPSFEKGDIHYSKKEYHLIFKRAKLDYKHYQNPKARIQAFVLKKMLH